MGEQKRREEAARKAAEEDAKKKALEEAEIRRQEMMEAQKEGGKKSRNSGPSLDRAREMSRTKEQLEEEKNISLRIRIKPLNLDEMDSDQLKAKAAALFNTISNLETEKYDYEQRQIMQDYELKELKERQKMQLRNKAIKKGLDPEALTGAHPPTIRMYSKYERRTDTRTYGDRKKLYEGQYEVERAEKLEAAWKEKYAEWTKRPKAVCPSGLVRGLARRLEILRPQRVEMKLLKKLRRKFMMKKKKKRRRRRKRRKSKSWSPIPEILIHRYLVLIGCLAITSKRTFQLSSHYHNIVLILVLKL